MNSLSGNGLTFKELEKKFFEIGCEIARNLMEQYLEAADKEIKESRNRAEFRHKSSRVTTIKTLVGEVTIKRTLYKRVREDGATEHVFLLDKALGMDTIGQISPNLVEKIAGHACEMSFREVAETVSGLTGQSITHQGVWDVVQAIGEKQGEAEKKLVEAYKENKLCGEKEVPILFEEADGLWLSMQRESRKGSSKGKKEMKVGVIYEGWEKRYPSAKEYKTVGKMAFAGYMKADEFKDLRDAAVAEKYNTDEIRYRVLNGDGAAWIRNGHETETDIFQLDAYHLAKSVIRNVYDKQAKRSIIRWLKAGEHEKALEKIEALKYACGGEEKEVKKLTELEEYIRNNIDGIVSYKEREGIKIPEPPLEMEYRNLGTMERNIDIFAERMKGAKSWSERGATNLSKIIALKMGQGFNDKIAALISGKVSERLEERFKEVVRNTKSRMHESVKMSLSLLLPFIPR